MERPQLNGACTTEWNNTREATTYIACILGWSAHHISQWYAALKGMNTLSCKDNPTITAVLNPSFYTLLPRPELNRVPADPPSSLTLSMSSASPSGKGLAFMNSRLCLLGDFDRQSLLLSSDTVSRYETTGSDFFRGMHAWSSSRSLRQISRCSSPAPAMMCSPLSSMMHCGERGEEAVLDTAAMYPNTSQGATFEVNQMRPTTGAGGCL